ncbi:Protein of unknown function [Anaerobranca californiensis DSM 14826]|uniref:DUF2797 domain-containing protein n=1 Tax=Anaerobranca californiensis DSM 14826 TaxID=1120989 RepID=A0A1M6NX73_9FIRM|nr:DUF2797 domain-containing protein [Anaerobranca californiensis]SHK00240.1 Protein of unknown function [Anaerobranca californiensis DSM 14826]
MEYGILYGMEPQLEDIVKYTINIGEEKILLNPWIGKRLKISYNGEKNCIACGRGIKKTFNQGYCYPCFRDLAENDLCIVKPHLCHFHQGTCRDPQFAQNHCFTEHYVYLAISSGVKVGITRKKTLFKRWMDQGAEEGIPIALVPDRKTAGLMEYFLSEYLNDKTDWRKMLKGESNGELPSTIEFVKDVLKKEFHPYLIEEKEITKITYPHVKPQKLKSLDLDKIGVIESKLLGIKGQYLILEDGVLNVRKHRGFNCIFNLV